MNYLINNDFSPIVRAPKIVRITDVDVLKMSCGGGMGGSQWNEYVIPMREYITNALNTLTDAFDKEEKRTKEINTRFVVTIEHKKLVEVSYDMTANHNFGYVKHCYYVIGRDDKISIVDDNCRIADDYKPHSIGWSKEGMEIKLSY